MAYEKQTWTTGEVITQEKLNHMEDGIANAGGFECTETVAEVFDDSVAITTSWNDSYTAELSLEEPLESAEIKVVFNGVEYTVERQEFYGMPYYGAPFHGAVSDYSTYPFCIFDDNADNVWSIAAQQSDTYNVKISAGRESVEVTPCFSKAVSSVAEPLIPEEYYTRFTISGNDDDGYTTSMSQSEICDRAMQGEGSYLVALNPRGVECYYAGYHQSIASFVGLYFHPTDAQLKAEVYRIPTTGTITHESIALPNND